MKVPEAQRARVRREPFPDSHPLKIALLCHLLTVAVMLTAFVLDLSSNLAKRAFSLGTFKVKPVIRGAGPLSPAQVAERLASKKRTQPRSAVSLFPFQNAGPAGPRFAWVCVELDSIQPR